MAFNWQTFRTRSLTAIVFVIIMMAGLLWSTWSYFLLFSVIHFGAWIEYGRLVEKFQPYYARRSTFHPYLFMGIGWCVMLYFTQDELRLFDISLSHIGFWFGLMLMILLPVVMWMESKLVFFRNLAYSIFGLLYLSLPLALMIGLRTEDLEATTLTDHQLAIPLLIIFSLWINDTMAYIVGSLIGRTTLSAISPKKTWEGTIGGVVLTILVISILAYATGVIQVLHAGIMAAIAAITGTFGDLFESKLKRMAGVKDSGQIMPGHGGFLDRFDSLLFAAVFIWFYVKVAM